ncbi:MAG: hypothetical protein HFE80_02220 [Clostridiaceae bacterium]|jgi:hypothetical protein|nr:hypothetical protein [Clostridiaceae bacterium]
MYGSGTFGANASEVPLFFWRAREIFWFRRFFQGKKRGKPAHEKRLCKIAETTPKNRDKKAAKQPKKMKFQLDERKYNISNMLKTMRKQIKTCAKLLRKQESIKKLL